MALNWKWEDRIGTMTLRQGANEFDLSLYEGNAYLIMLHEYEEDGKNLYTMYSFFADKEHMKNMLGLSKKNHYGENFLNEPGNKATKFRINKKKYSHTKELVTALAEAFDDITIELFTEEESTK